MNDLPAKGALLGWSGAVGLLAAWHVGFAGAGFTDVRLDGCARGACCDDADRESGKHDTDGVFHVYFCLFVCLFRGNGFMRLAVWQMCVLWESGAQ